jgi:hypothetical protein
MDIINLITGLFLIGLGFLVKFVPNLIAGYNTMSKEQKKNVDIKGLSSFIRNGLIVIGLVIILGYYLFDWLKLSGIANSMILISVLGGTTFLVIKAQRFDHNKVNKSSIRKSKLVFIITGITLISVIGLIYYGTISPKITLSERSIKISGIYGQNINIADIKNVELVNNIPEIILKTNGFNFGETLKGNFKLKDYGNCKLFLKSKDGPFLMIIDNKGERILINYENRTDTEQQFEELKKMMNK